MVPFAFRRNSIKVAPRTRDANEIEGKPVHVVHASNITQNRRVQHLAVVLRSVWFGGRFGLLNIVLRTMPTPMGSTRPGPIVAIGFRTRRRRHRCRSNYSPPGKARKMEPDPHLVPYLVKWQAPAVE